MMIKILGTLILLCAIPSHAAVEQWRGKLEISKQISLVVGVNIDTDTQTLTLDSPNQKMFEYVPTEASVSDKAVSFSDNKLNASYEGQFVDGKLVGTFTQGKARPLTFSLLTADAKSQLALEGTYAGALDINGKKLPLELQVAALEDGFHATLDSPAQQSFGIPLSQFAITTQVLSFESEMINAAFKGTMKEGEYNGTFTQGFAMPLSLKKNRMSVSDKYVNGNTEQILAEHFKGINAAIAIIADGQPRHYFFGDKVNEHALFEVGSLTKPMVATVASDLVQSHQWLLSEPIAKLLEDKTFTHHQYSLQQLITHTSGLPRLPSNFSPADMNNPYATYDTNQLLVALKATVGDSKAFEYSNYGYAVLAYLLTKQLDGTLDTILNERLFKPLGMNNTVMALSTDNKHEEINLVGAQDYYGERVQPWQFDSLAGAGAAVSSLHDMQQWVSSYWRFEQSNPLLHQKMSATLTPLNEQMSYGWMRQFEHTYWHNGQTGGYASMVIFNPNKQQAVIVLAAGVANVTQIGMLLFNQLDKQ